MVESREGLAKARGERLVHESRLTIAVIEDTIFGRGLRV